MAIAPPHCHSFVTATASTRFSFDRSPFRVWHHSRIKVVATLPRSILKDHAICVMIPVMTSILCSLLLALAVLAPDVQEKQDLRYYEGSGSHSKKHLLNLYLPVDRKDPPIVIFVHGGSWKRGDKDAYGGAYARLGRSLAGTGLAVAIINYRLSPEVRHPEHARDVARALAWVHKQSNVYGWNQKEIFLMGHSAGAHLASLVAVDPFYLAERGLKPNVVRGVVAISGVYDLELTGISGQFLYESVFSTERQMLRKASPTSQVGTRPAPFLLLYAEEDYVTADFQARRFEKALKAAGGKATTHAVADRNHVNIVVGVAKKGDPVQEKVLAFINRLAP